MSSRPLQDVPPPNANFISKGYGNASSTADFAPAAGRPSETSPLAQSFHQGGMSELDAPDGGGFNRNPSASRSRSQARNRNSSQAPLLQDEQGEHNDLQRTLSYGSSKSGTAIGGVSRSNTLKKSQSVSRAPAVGGPPFSRKGSVKRSGSRKSLAAGSIGTMAGVGGGVGGEYNSVFHTPIPTSGTPTEILANRFQGA